MTTALATIPQTSTVELANQLADSNLLPAQYRRQPANLIFAFEYADALSIPRINALTSIHIIEGKPSASAELIGALVRRAGHKLRVQGDDTYAEAVIIRADDPDFIPTPVHWDMQRAQNARLTSKDNWKKYPAAMLRARAISEAARAWAPDALFGIVYTPEELGAQVSEDGTPIITTVEPQQQPQQRQQQAAAPSEPARELLTAERADYFVAALVDARTIEDLEAVWSVVRTGTDPGEHAQTLIDAYQARGRFLTEQAAAPSEPAEPVQETIDAEATE